MTPTCSKKYQFTRTRLVPLFK